MDTVPGAAAVRSDLGTAWLSLAAMIAILLAMGWVGELFNDTLEANYDRILAAWRASRLRHLVRSALGRGAGL